MIGKEAIESFLKDYTTDKSAVLVAYYKKGEPAEVYCGGYSDDLLALLTSTARKLADNMGIHPQVLLYMMDKAFNAVTAKEQKEPMQ